MTDKEIIKALNTATNIDGLQICCIDCENNPENATYLSIKSDIVDLINRQQAEVERLTVNMNAFGLGMKTEKERADNARTEAIKEFAERLKEEIDKSVYQYWNEGSGGYYLAEDVSDDINNLVKEMAGEDK